MDRAPKPFPELKLIIAGEMAARGYPIGAASIVITGAVKPGDWGTAIRRHGPKIDMGAQATIDEVTRRLNAIYSLRGPAG